MTHYQNHCSRSRRPALRFCPAGDCSTGVRRDTRHARVGPPAPIVQVRTACLVPATCGLTATIAGTAAPTSGCPAGGPCHRTQGPSGSRRSGSTSVEAGVSSRDTGGGDAQGAGRHLLRPAPVTVGARVARRGARAARTRTARASSGTDGQPVETGRAVERPAAHGHKRESREAHNPPAIQNAS